MDGPDVTAHRAREQPPPSVTCRLMNSRLVLLMEEPFGPQKTTLCLDTRKQWDTSGVLGAQTQKKGRWCPRSRTAPALTWEKRGTEWGGTGTLAPIFPFYRDQGGGDSFTQQSLRHWNPIRSMMSTQQQRISSVRILFEKKKVPSMVA